MFCSNCGYDLKEKEMDKALKENSEVNPEAINTFVCPRCGKIIKPNLNNDEVKALARASHAEIHKSRNLHNTGMAFLVTGIIVSIIAFMFYLLCYKASNQGRFSYDCSEFYVFVVLAIVGLTFLVISCVNLIRGRRKSKLYSTVLKEIQDGVFIQ